MTPLAQGALRFKNIPYRKKITDFLTKLGNIIVHNLIDKKIAFCIILKIFLTSFKCNHNKFSIFCILKDICTIMETTYFIFFHLDIVPELSNTIISTMVYGMVAAVVLREEDDDVRPRHVGPVLTLRE